MGVDGDNEDSASEHVEPIVDVVEDLSDDVKSVDGTIDRLCDLVSDLIGKVDQLINTGTSHVDVNIDDDVVKDDGAGSGEDADSDILPEPDLKPVKRPKEGKTSGWFAYHNRK